MHPNQELLVDDLWGDHGSVRALLRRFELSESPDDRRDAMRLATDLFSVHSEIEERIASGYAQHRALQAIIHLMEQLETTDPRSKLYLARGMELKQRLEEYIAVEEQTAATPSSGSLKAEPYNVDLLGLRTNLRDNATRLLRVH
ncbi:MAG TPA: hypothetical protein VHE37_08385 [Nevskiaceae bacterium]|nr:hypothetical protein [Nevskiaceae bacterium]